MTKRFPASEVFPRHSLPQFPLSEQWLASRAHPPSYSILVWCCPSQKILNCRGQLCLIGFSVLLQDLSLSLGPIGQWLRNTFNEWQHKVQLCCCYSSDLVQLLLRAGRSRSHRIHYGLHTWVVSALYCRAEREWDELIVCSKLYELTIFGLQTHSSKVLTISTLLRWAAKLIGNTSRLFYGKMRLAPAFHGHKAGVPLCRQHSMVWILHGFVGRRIPLKHYGLALQQSGGLCPWREAQYHIHCCQQKANNIYVASMSCS